MAHPDGDRELSNVNLIIYTMVKLSKCGDLYTKAIDRWKTKDAMNKKIWANFLSKRGRKNLIQEIYKTEFNTTKGTKEDYSIIDSIVQYPERAAAAKVKVQALEDLLNQLELGHNQPLL